MIENLYGEEDRKERLSLRFRTQYNAEPRRMISAPGQIEILGGYCESNGGKALSSAVSCDILCAASKRQDDVIEIVAENFLPIRISASDLGCREREKGKSIALARGALSYLRQCGYSFGGFSAYTDSAIPERAKLSSSSAFAVLAVEIVNVLYLEKTLSPYEKAKAAKYAETVYFGSQNGYLEEIGVAFGGIEHTDFSGKEPKTTQIPALQGYSLLLLNPEGNSMAQSLEIRRDMKEVCSYFSKNTLGEIPFELFEEHLPRLRRFVSDRAIMRAFHFFEENERVGRAAQALLDGNIQAFLQQIQKSGESCLCFLQDCSSSGSAYQPASLAMKLCETYLKDGAFRLTKEGIVLAFVQSGCEELLWTGLSRIFGRENLFFTQIREKGACEL